MKKSRLIAVSLAILALLAMLAVYAFGAAGKGAVCTTNTACTSGSCVSGTCASSEAELITEINRLIEDMKVRLIPVPSSELPPGAGARCTTNADCASGLICISRTCTSMR